MQTQFSIGRLSRQGNLTPVVKVIHDGVNESADLEPQVDFSPARVAGTLAAHPTLLKREIDELMRLGVSADAIDKPAPLRGGRIVWVTRDRFEFEAHVHYGPSQRAFLIGVRDVHGAPLDIVAWQPAANRLGTWRGLAWAINQDSIFRPRVQDSGALLVHRSPLEWLKIGRRGIVLIDARAATGYLHDAAPLLAEDAEHGLELRDRLTVPPPRIVIPAAAARAA
jgi:hypothetical protein